MKKDAIFVFGSNTAGIHGAGAAKDAWANYGAIMGCGFGHMGMSFAIPTKDRHLNTLPHWDIQKFVNGFIKYAEMRPDLDFQVTRIGCGLAGIRDSTMADMFDFAPSNCFFDSKWKELMPEGHNFWGTF